MATKEPADLTTKVLVEIRDELKTLRHEHGALLADHGAQLAEIRSELGGQRAEHGARFEDIRAELRGHGVTLTQVLRAVEHGNTQLDEHVLDHEARITRLEERTGIHQ